MLWVTQYECCVVAPTHHHINYDCVYIEISKAYRFDFLCFVIAVYIIVIKLMKFELMKFELMKYCNTLIPCTPSLKFQHVVSGNLQ